MRCTFCDLSEKEVINICDGRRLGHVEDLELNIIDGRILALIVPGPPKCWGLIRAEKDCVIPWCKIKKIGDDVILVEYGDAIIGEVIK